MLPTDELGDTLPPDPYTPDEWATIYSAIHEIEPALIPVRVDRARDHIAGMARMYRRRRDDYKEWEQHPGGAEIERAAWNTMLKALQKLQSATSAVKHPGRFFDPILEAIFAEGDRSGVQELLGWALGAITFRSELMDLDHPVFRLVAARTGRALQDRMVLELIQRWIEAAEDMSKPRRRYDKHDLRIFFYRDLLRTWTDLGGELGFSRPSSGPRKGRPQGPLIRFLRAATTPIVGEVPLETLVTAVKREKRRRGRRAEACNGQAINGSGQHAHH